MPQGLALYVRKISRRRHGTPKDFAKKCKDHGLSWIALGGLWQEKRSHGRVTSAMINGTATLYPYGDALEAAGVEVYVWGYPWQGHEKRFVDSMVKAAPWGRVLLDPELGSNPSRSGRGKAYLAAEDHARTLVTGLKASRAFKTVGLSTFGGAARMRWFPFDAFTESLIEHFGGNTFVGGQTYTDDAVINRSIADMQKAILQFGIVGRSTGTKYSEGHCQVVPNFGLYTWVKDGKRGRRRPGAKAVPKTPAELRGHLYEFINEGEPVDAMIGWAENFATKSTWRELARFADMMNRGACTLSE